MTEETEEVDLPGEEVDDSDISQLSTFKNIKSLLLGENLIGNEGVATIASCLTHVTKLQLNSNRFDSSALCHLGELKQLKVLDLRNNGLGNSSLHFLGKLTNLVELSLSKNSITDDGVKALSDLRQLTYLDLTTNAVTE